MFLDSETEVPIDSEVVGLDLRRKPSNCSFPQSLTLGRVKLEVCPLDASCFRVSHKLPQGQRGEHFVPGKVILF